MQITNFLKCQRHKQIDNDNLAKIVDGSMDDM